MNDTTRTGLNIGGGVALLGGVSAGAAFAQRTRNLAPLRAEHERFNGVGYAAQWAETPRPGGQPYNADAFGGLVRHLDREFTAAGRPDHAAVVRAAATQDRWVASAGLRELERSIARELPPLPGAGAGVKLVLGGIAGVFTGIAALGAANAK